MIAADYVTSGLALVGIPSGKKGPTSCGWNLVENAIRDPVRASALSGNIGLAHAYCTPRPTAVLDIDDIAQSSRWLAVRGIDLQALLDADDAVQIVSGREGRAKLLYWLPAGTRPLPMHVVKTRQQDGSQQTTLEFRCATRDGLTVQDVLPPSIHPDTGQPYRWGGKGDWKSIPEIPKTLLAVWRSELTATLPPARPRSSGIPIDKSIQDTPHERERVREMLAHISADCSYEQYRNIVWAILSLGWHDAEKVAQEWCQTAPHQFDPRIFAQTVASYVPSRSPTIGTIIHHAKEGGWKAKRVDHSVGQIANPTATAGRFTLLDRNAIMAQPELRWRVKGLFPQEGIGAVYGPSQSGKSFLTFDMGCAVALGKNWFGHRTTASPVTYVMLEGEAALRNRVEAWEQHNNCQLPTKFRAVCAPLELAEDADIQALAAILPQHGLAIIDTLNRAAPGLDENSSQDMGRILAGMKSLQSATQGLVLVVHHTGKDASKGMRGHSSLHAALDGAIEVERTGLARSWHAAKVKDGKDGEGSAFKLELIDLGVDADGDPKTSCAVAPDTATVFAVKEPTGKSQRPALAAIRQAIHASATFGQGGCGPQDQCIAVDDAIAAIVPGLVTTASNKRNNRARQLVQDLVSGGYVRSGVDAAGIAWVWLS